MKTNRCGTIKEEAKALFLLLAVVAFFVAVVGAAIWWQMYRWHDCRIVGHSWLYCLATVSR